MSSHLASDDDMPPPIPPLESRSSVEQLGDSLVQQALEWLEANSGEQKDSNGIPAPSPVGISFMEVNHAEQRLEFTVSFPSGDARAQAVIKDEDLSGWICGSCTLFNEETSAACTVCDAAAPLHILATCGQWTCAACTFENGTEERATCSMCGAAAPPTPEPRELAASRVATRAKLRARATQQAAAHRDPKSGNAVHRFFVNYRDRPLNATAGTHADMQGFAHSVLLYCYDGRSRSVGDILCYTRRYFTRQLQRGGDAGLCRQLSEPSKAAAGSGSGSGSSSGEDGDGSGDDTESDTDSEYAYESSGEEEGLEEPEQAPALAHSRSHLSVSSEELQRMQRRLIESMAREHSLSVGAAGTLLRHVGWCEREARDRLRVDKEAFCAEAGVPAHKVEVECADDGQEYECMICMDDVPKSETMALACAHRFCKDCYTDNVTNLVNSGDVRGNSCLSSTCPYQGCPFVIGEEVYKALLPDALYRKFLRILTLSFVDDNAAMVWCPRPGCSNVVAFSKRKHNVQCACGYRFCFQCKEEAHAPAVCANVRAWMAKKEKNKGKISKMKDVKPCPNPDCRAPSTKVSGCMYVSCRVCKCNWCWQCGDWGGVNDRPQPHHVYNCNNPVNQSWSNSSGALFSDDGRFMFYSERAQNHRMSEEFAEKQRAQAVSHMEELMLAGNDHSHVEFLREAVELVIYCRKVLYWTYVYAFFETDDGRRTLFEFVQNDLEQYTEKLSGMTEKTIEELVENKQAVRDWTVALHKFLDSIVHWKVLDVDGTAAAGADLVRRINTIRPDRGDGEAKGGR